MAAESSRRCELLLFLFVAFIISSQAVEYILPDQQGAFVKELESHVLKCVKDANGNHGCPANS